MVTFKGDFLNSAIVHGSDQRWSKDVLVAELRRELDIAAEGIMNAKVGRQYRQAVDQPERCSGVANVGCGGGVVAGWLAPNQIETHHGFQVERHSIKQKAKKEQELRNRRAAFQVFEINAQRYGGRQAGSEGTDGQAG